MGNTTSANVNTLPPTTRYRINKLGGPPHQHSSTKTLLTQPKLIFKCKELRHHKTTDYVFRDGYRYHETGYSRQSSSIQQTFKCSERDCRAFIKTIDKNPLDYEYGGPHILKQHVRYDQNDLRIFDFKEQVKKRVQGGDQPHEAYNNVAREQPDVAEQVRGYDSVRNVAWNVRYETRGKLPKHKKDWGEYLRREGIDGNYYDQLLNNGKPEEDDILQQWEARRGAFYLGDGGTSGRYQIFCPREGAKVLSECDRIYVDCSYKFMPRQSPHSIDIQPYGAGCHLIAGFLNENNECVPCTVPGATVLFGPDHPDEEEYYGGFKLLREMCQKEYGFDIVRDDHVLETMGDMETPLRGAIHQMWPKSKRKICAFHYSQRLNTNIGNKNLNRFYRSNVPPKLVPKCWNILRKERKKIYSQCKEQMDEFIQYHKKTYMKDGSWIVSWNHYRSYVRTNNELERKNGILNARLGRHPFLDKWVMGMAEWYMDEYIKFKQYVNNGVQSKRHKKEILKNELLDKCWDFVDENQDQESLMIFLKYSSIALKGNQQVLQKILKRKCFYQRV
eukprot:104813_1